MTAKTYNIAITTGIGLVSVGAGLIYVPAGLITAGLLVIAATVGGALLAAR